MGLFLLVELESQFGLGAGAGVADLHVSELPAALHFLEAAQGEFLEQLAGGVESLGLEDAAGLEVDPREHSAIAFGRGLGVGALEDPAGSTPAHLGPKDALAGPMEKLQAEILHPEVGSGEGFGQSSGGLP